MLQLLNELEAGASVDGDLPLGETLPTPVPRLHHEGDSARRAAIGGHPAEAAREAPSRRHAQALMTVDLGPFLAAVPDAVVERLRGARRVLAVGHENPDADTLGATLGVVSIVEALGAGRPTPSARTRFRRSTTSCRASNASGPTPIPTPSTTCS